MTEERVEYLGKQPSINDTTLIQEESGNDLRKYRTEMPNIVDDMGLDPYSFRLYVHLRRVVGSEGKCWQNTKTLAKTCSMSAGKISDAKKILVRHNLIRVEERDHDESDVITVLNIWPQNFEHFSAMKESDPVHHMNTPVHHMNTPRSPHELKKEPITKNKPKEEKGDSATAPKPSDHPAVQAYRDTFLRFPPKAQMKAIAEVDPDFGNWVRAVREWNLRGYNPINIKGMLEWAANPSLMERFSGKESQKKDTMRKEEGDGQVGYDSGWTPETLEHYKRLKREGKPGEAGEYLRSLKTRV